MMEYMKVKFLHTVNIHFTFSDLLLEPCATLLNHSYVHINELNWKSWGKFV